MNHLPPAELVTALLLLGSPAALIAQDASAALPPLEVVDRGTWSVADGQGPTWRDALTQAIEAAVQRVNGVRVAQGPAMRARLGLLKQGEAGLETKEQVLEVGAASQQLEGFVDHLEVLGERKSEDGRWTLRVRCLVAGYDPKRADFVVLLGGNTQGERSAPYQDLGSYRVVDFDEQAGRGQKSGPFAIPGTRIGECLVNTGRVKLGYSGPGVRLDADSDPREAQKRGRALVATHQIDIEWEPVELYLVTRKPSASLPGRRPQQMFDSARVTAKIRVRNLVEKTMLPAFELPMLLPAAFFQRPGENAAANDRDALARHAQRAAQFAEAEVATAVYFALQPPVVLRCWQAAGEDSPWQVEVDLPSHLAQEFASFELGRHGALRGGEWRSLGACSLAADAAPGRTTIFRLAPNVDPKAIVPGVTLLRPLASY